MEKKSKIRFTEIDVYRGWAILLVIFGHSFCEFPVNLREDFASLQTFISSFNMSMFFWISGLLFSVSGPWADFFNKKLKRLMLPWIVFVVLSITMRTVAGSFTHSHIGSFGHELLLAVTTAKYYWFLYALFLMMLLTRAIKNKWLLALVGGVIFTVHVVGIKPTWNALLINRLFNYYPWFVMGFLLKGCYQEMSGYVKSHIAALGIIACMMFLTIAIVNVGGMMVKIPVVTPLCLCACLWIMAVGLTTYFDNERFFTWFGKYSLQYYLNHLLIMMGCFYVGARCYVVSPLLSLIVVFLLGVTIATAMLLVEKRFKWLRTLCGFN